MKRERRGNMGMTDNNGNKRKVPALTKKEAEELGHLFPPDVQREISLRITKLG